MNIYPYIFEKLYNYTVNISTSDVRDTLSKGKNYEQENENTLVHKQVALIYLAYFSKKSNFLLIDNIAIIGQLT